MKKKNELINMNYNIETNTKGTERMTFIASIFKGIIDGNKNPRDIGALRLTTNNGKVGD